MTNSESFKYKVSIIGKTAIDGNAKEVELSVPLKHISNFWRTLDIPLKNCKISLTLTWSKNCALTGMTTRDKEGDNPAKTAPTGATFAITGAKLCATVVTLSTENNNKLLGQLKTGFKRTIEWNKDISELCNQAKTNNLNYLIDPRFSKVNKLFVLSFKITEDENKDDRTSFSEYYTPTVEIKDFNVLINGKSLFDVIIKNKEETYEKFIEMGKNNDYTTGNLLDYDYFSNYYKLISINLSKQIELENLDLKHEINFIGKLEENNGAKMFSIIEKSEETTFNFSKNSISII